MLRHYIRHYWILQSDRANVVTERTFPLGCIQIFFHKKKRLFSQTHHKMQPRYFVCGQEKGYTDILEGKTKPAKQAFDEMRKDFNL